MKLKEALIAKLESYIEEEKIHNPNDDTMVIYWTTIITRLKAAFFNGELVNIIWEDLFYSDEDSKDIFLNFINEMDEDIHVKFINKAIVDDYHS